jgi:hypothetical protein
VFSVWATISREAEGIAMRYQSNRDDQWELKSERNPGYHIISFNEGLRARVA